MAHGEIHAGEIMPAPGRAMMRVLDDAPMTYLAPASMVVAEAIDAVHDLLPHVAEARAARDAAAARLGLDASHRRRIAVLSPAAAALLTAAIAGAAVAASVPLRGSAGWSAIVLSLHVPALGGLAAIALRRLADQSRPRRHRLAWLGGVLLALAGLAGFGAEALTSAAPRYRFSAMIGVAGVAALPWLFARLPTAARRRERSACDRAAEALRAAEDRAARALGAAREAFESEALALAAAIAGVGQDGAAEPPERPRDGTAAGWPARRPAPRDWSRRARPAGPRNSLVDADDAAKESA